jgi:hypothetical protein
MTDPADMFRRSADLRARAETENDPELKTRLIQMAETYAHIAEHEQWLAAHPTSLAAIGDLFRKS